MQAEQVWASLEAKGTPQRLHDGPAYRLILLQQLLQSGAQRTVSVALSHTGQRDGKRWLRRWAIRPEASGGRRIFRTWDQG